MFYLCIKINLFTKDGTAKISQILPLMNKFTLMRLKSFWDKKFMSLYWKIPCIGCSYNVFFLRYKSLEENHTHMIFSPEHEPLLNSFILLLLLLLLCFCSFHLLKKKSVLWWYDGLKVKFRMKNCFQAIFMFICLRINIKSAWE